MEILKSETPPCSNIIVRPKIPRNTHPIETGRYIFPTNEINKLYEKVKTSVQNRVPGTVIHGRPRLGKSKAIDYLMCALPVDFEKLPMYTLLCREHAKPNEDVFFSEILKDVGHGFSLSGKAYVKRERLMKFLLERAETSGQQRTVFFIDDAQNLHSIQYSWLMDISNELDRAGISLTVFLVGQEQLINQRSVFFEEGRYQIIGRFMVEPHQFHGVQSEDDLMECLISYDEDSVYPVNSGWSFTQYYFPYAFEDGFRLQKCASELFGIFDDLRIQAKIKKLEIPMQYFTRTIEFALRKFGIDGEDLDWLHEAQWREAIENSGYVEAELYQGT